MYKEREEGEEDNKDKNNDKELIFKKGKCKVFITDDGGILLNGCAKFYLSSSDRDNIRRIFNYINKED